MLAEGKKKRVKTYETVKIENLVTIVDPDAVFF